MPPLGPDRSLVLCYHAISRSWSGAVDPAALERQLRLLLARGYRPARFTDAVIDRSAQRSLVVTFDDGYRSVLEAAFPVLASLGVPGTAFVPTGFVGASVAAWPGTSCWVGGPHERELAALGWDELRVLRDAGWEIGSHTATHPHLVALDDDRLVEELVSSRAAIERALGGRCRSLAYPYGETDARVQLAAAEAGYEAACRLTDSFAGPTPLAWPRVGVFRHDGPLRFRAKVLPAVVRLRATPGWALLRRGGARAAAG